MQRNLEREKLITEMMVLAYLVQVNTKYGVFINFSGHVDSLEVQICPSKEDYLTKLAHTDFNIERVDSWHEDPLCFLKEKRDILKNILETGEIDTSEMEEYIETTISHVF